MSQLARFCFVIALLLPTLAQARRLPVAITVEALPGNVADLEAIQSAFAARHLPPATGFVQGRTLGDGAAGTAALQGWLAAGNRLGNGSYNHSNLRDVGADAFITDVQRNEALLQQVTGETRSWRVFRYPFLEEGTDATEQDAVRTYLRGAGYVVAPVTIDVSEREWDAAYARCMTQGNTSMAFTIARGMVADTLLQLLWADEMARAVVGRPIPHILRVYSGNLLADNATDLLQALTEHGVQFIALDTALQDPVYGLELGTAAGASGNFLQQYAAVHPAEHTPTPVQHPSKWLSEQCR